MSFLEGIVDAVATATFDQVEIRTAFSPAVRINIKDKTPSPLAQLLKPTVVLRGNLGEQVIAPNGVAPPDGGVLLAVAGVTVALALIGVGVILGRASA